MTKRNCETAHSCRKSTVFSENNDIFMKCQMGKETDTKKIVIYHSGNGFKAGKVFKTVRESE